MVKFSIVIPVFNMSDYIFRTVHSLLEQTYQHYEVILVDDGSIDNSGEICDQLAYAHDNVSVIHTSNQGSGPARNKGISVATGDYIYFPDADDIVNPNALMIFSSVLEKTQIDLVVFGYEEKNPNGKCLYSKSYEEMSFSGDAIRQDYFDFFSMKARFGIQGAPWNKLFRLSLIREREIAFPPLRRHQDEAFIGIYMNYVSTVKFIPNILYTYYSNDLGREWDKYPKDYISCVLGLYEFRKQSILTWNKEDEMTHNCVELSLISGVIKAMELSFSPKMSLSRPQRIDMITGIIAIANIGEKKIGPSFKMRYQRIVLKLVRRKKIRTLYCLIKLKVAIEKKIRTRLSFLFPGK